MPGKSRRRELKRMIGEARKARGADGPDADIRDGLITDPEELAALPPARRVAQEIQARECEIAEKYGCFSPHPKDWPEEMNLELLTDPTLREATARLQRMAAGT